VSLYLHIPKRILIFIDLDPTIHGTSGESELPELIADFEVKFKARNSVEGIGMDMILKSHNCGINSLSPVVVLRFFQLFDQISSGA
jgi:hypothetical protein